MAKPPSPWLISHQPQRSREGRGLRMQARPNAGEQGFDLWIGAGMPTDKICMQIRVGKFQKCLEVPLIASVEGIVGGLEEADQQHVQLAHAAAAAPAQSRAICLHRGESSANGGAGP